MGLGNCYRQQATDAGNCSEAVRQQANDAHRNCSEAVRQQANDAGNCWAARRHAPDLSGGSDASLRARACWRAAVSELFGSESAAFRHCSVAVSPQAVLNALCKNRQAFEVANSDLRLETSLVANTEWRSGTPTPERAKTTWAQSMMEDPVPALLAGHGERPTEVTEGLRVIAASGDWLQRPWSSHSSGAVP